MNPIEQKLAEIHLGVLKLQHKLLESRLKGDLPGHPFRGNQYSGGGGGVMAPDRDSGSGVATEEHESAPEVRSFVSKLDPDIQVSVNKSGRVIKLKKDNVAQVDQGAGDGKWRVRYGEKGPGQLVEEVRDRNSGLEEAAKYVSSKYSERLFRQQSAAAREGEADDSET